MFAVGADNMAWDVPGLVDPELGCTLPGHLILLVRRGIYMVENLKTDELAAERVHRFTFVCAPLKFVGATGSPVRPLAVCRRRPPARTSWREVSRVRDWWWEKGPVTARKPRSKRGRREDRQADHRRLTGCQRSAERRTNESRGVLRQGGRVPGRRSRAGDPSRSVKVKVDWCGICGTDLHEYLAGPIFIPAPASLHPITG